MTEGPKMFSEERHDDGGGNVLRELRENAIDGRGERDQREEGAEPGDRLARPIEHERAEGRDERPERDGARLHKSPQTPLEEEREKEEHRDLARAVGGVALRPGEENEPDQRGDLVGKWNQRRAPEPKRRIRPDPNERERGDQERREDERRLTQPLIGSVRRLRADGGSLPDDRVRPFAEAHAPDSRTRPKRASHPRPERPFRWARSAGALDYQRGEWDFEGPTGRERQPGLVYGEWLRGHVGITNIERRGSPASWIGSTRV